MLGLSLWMHAADSGLVQLERDFAVRVWHKEHGLPDDRALALLRDRVRIGMGGGGLARLTGSSSGRFAARGRPGKGVGG